MYFKRGLLLTEGMHRNWACRKFRQTQFEASLCLFFFFFLFFYGMSFEILGLENCPCGSQSLLKLPLGLSSSPWLASNTRGVKEAVKHEAFTAALYGFLIGFFCYKHSKKMRLTEKKTGDFRCEKKKENKRLHSRVRGQLISSLCREPNVKEKKYRRMRALLD